MQAIEKYVDNTNAIQLFAQGGIDQALHRIEKDARSIVADVSTSAGRKSIASVARRVASSKVALDDLGKSLTTDLRRQLGAIDSERRKVRDRLDALRDEVRQPLTEYEHAEQKRKDELIARGKWFETVGEELQSSDDIAKCLDEVRKKSIDDMAEYTEAAYKAKHDAMQRLDAAFIIARDREAKEFERHQAEKEAREREIQERAERIAKEKEEAARLQAERDKRQAAEREEALKIKAERDKREAAEQAQRLADEKKQAEQRAIEANARAKLLEQQARDREEAESRKAEAEEQRKRERQAEVHRELHQMLTKAIGMSETDAKRLIMAVYKGNIPQLKIVY